jgi:hypothetical protein
MIEPEMVKVVEVAEPERMLDSRHKTAMLTMATWADFFRVEEDWHHLRQWREWRHGRHVTEVSHFGEHTTMQGDVLAICPLESDDVVCQVQVTEIRMVNVDRLSDAEVRELGYASRAEYDLMWGDMGSGSSHGWFMRFMLLSDSSSVLH